jgi:hypothetical protein
VIIRLANLFQRRDNKIKSRVPHPKHHPKFCARLQILVLWGARVFLICDKIESA